MVTAPNPASESTVYRASTMCTTGWPREASTTKNGNRAQPRNARPSRVSRAACAKGSLVFLATVYGSTAKAGRRSQLTVPKRYWPASSITTSRRKGFTGTGDTMTRSGGRPCACSSRVIARRATCDAASITTA